VHYLIWIYCISVYRSSIFFFSMNHYVQGHIQSMGPLAHSDLLIRVGHFALFFFEKIKAFLGKINPSPIRSSHWGARPQALSKSVIMVNPALIIVCVCLTTPTTKQFCLHVFYAAVPPRRVVGPKNKMELAWKVYIKKDMAKFILTN